MHCPFPFEHPILLYKFLIPPEPEKKSILILSLNPIPGAEIELEKDAYFLPLRTNHLTFLKYSLIDLYGNG